MIQHYSTPLSLKHLSEKGRFSGYASVFNHIDAHQDVLVKGAFQKTLADFKKQSKTPKMLWQHDPAQLIGKWTHLEEDEKGLYVEGQLFLNLVKGLESYTLLKEGVLDSLSIGFSPARMRMGKTDGTREITEVTLYEISLVTFAANTEARILSLKQHETEALLLESFNRAMHLLSKTNTPLISE